MKSQKIGECLGSLLFIIISFCFLNGAVKLGITTRVLTNTQPGPGMYPLVVSIAIILVGCLLIITNLLKKKEYDFQQTYSAVAEDREIQNEKKQNQLIIITNIIILSVAFVLWKYIGFYPVAFLMCFSLSMLYGNKVKLSIILSLVAVGFVYLAFTYGLSIKFRI